MSENLKEELAEIGIYIIEDIVREDGIPQVKILYDDEVEYLSYDGTDKDLIEALDELAFENPDFWDHMAEYHLGGIK